MKETDTSIRNKRVGDVSWSDFRRMLTYKTQWYGNMSADTWFQSRWICSQSGSTVPQSRKRPPPESHRWSITEILLPNALFFFCFFLSYCSFHLLQSLLTVSDGLSHQSKTVLFSCFRSSTFMMIVYFLVHWKNVKARY